MTRTQKQEIVSLLTEEFKAANAVVVCGFSGVSHTNLETLRQDARAANVKVRVSKNTLTAIALSEAGYESMEMNQNNIFIWAEDQIAACKIADKFAAANQEAFVIKGGFIETKAVDVATINSYAKLPGREELIGMLLSVWTAPARNFVTGLDNLAKKLEEDAA